MEWRDRVTPLDGAYASTSRPCPAGIPDAGSFSVRGEPVPGLGEHRAHAFSDPGPRARLLVRHGEQHDAEHRLRARDRVGQGEGSIPTRLRLTQWSTPRCARSASMSAMRCAVSLFASEVASRWHEAVAAAISVLFEPDDAGAVEVKPMTVGAGAEHFYCPLVNIEGRDAVWAARLLPIDESAAADILSTPLWSGVSWEVMHRITSRPHARQCSVMPLSERAPARPQPFGGSRTYRALLMTAKDLADQATTLAEKVKPGTWEAVQALALASIAQKPRSDE